jgi:hypothetical protein
MKIRANGYIAHAKLTDEIVRILFYVLSYGSFHAYLLLAG